MISLWLGSVLLIAFALLFVLFPRRQQRDIGQDVTASSLQWYRQREQELVEQADADLVADAQLRVLEETPDGQGAMPAPVYSQQWRRWPLALAIVLATGALYWQLGAAPDMQIARQLEALGESGGDAAAVDMLGAAIERRAAQRPDNQHYASLLGQWYMGQERYGEAAKVYARMLDRTPDDPVLLAYTAQSSYLAGGRQLTPAIEQWLAKSLAADPHQRTALGLWGMALFEQGDYGRAQGYWEQLLALQAPDSPDARMIGDMVAMAKARAQGGTTAQAEPGEEANEKPGEEPAAGLGLVITLDVPEQAIAASDTVFVLARPANSDGRMPLAVRRFSGAQLPPRIVLDDRHSMAGQTFSPDQPLTVAVQVSPSGRPGAGNASWQGELTPVTASQPPATVTVTLSNGAQ